MAGTLYDANNVAVGHAILWLAPWSPIGPIKTIVPDTTALWDTTAWETAGFFSAGATDEGFKMNVETSTTTITIEEQSTPVLESIEGKTVNIEAALAEDTMASMQLTLGGGNIVTSAATASAPGTSKMSLADDIRNFYACLEMKNSKGLARRIWIPKVSATGSGDIEFRRAAAKRMYPLRLASLCKPTDIQIVDIVAPKTA